MRTANKSTSILAIASIALIIYWSFSALIPSVDGVSDEDFSIQNVRNHLTNIAAAPHYVGTKAHKDVQNYIKAELEKLGLKVSIQQQGAFGWGTGTKIENIVARIKGTKEGKALMLLSHYDSAVPVSLGASDDGSGVATILEGVRVFLERGQQPKNDIIILISDAEELGLIGAKAFIRHHEWVDDIGLVINFEARGSGGPSYMLMETNGKNSKLIKEFKKANPSHPVANSLMYSIYKMLPNDTDLTPFREEGNINGFNFAFIGDHFDYHMATDSPERLDEATLVHQANYLMSMLGHFAFLESLELDSDSDDIFVNFPIIKLLHYPFSWNGPLFYTALILFVVIVFAGILNGQLGWVRIMQGFVPFLLSLLVCIGVTLGLIFFFLWIHPQYRDMLHGFTYNGYAYIIAFMLLNAFLLLLIYQRFWRISAANLMIAPLVFWLIANGAVMSSLPGASFLIIPVFFGLITLGLLVFSNIRAEWMLMISVLLAIPLLYIISPLLRSFPVGLSLLFIAGSAVLLVLKFGLLIPSISLNNLKVELMILLAMGSLTYFVIATANSGFDEDNKKPNHIVYHINADSRESYWVTYNTVMDDFLDQFFEGEGVAGRPDASWIRSGRITYHRPVDTKSIAPPKIRVIQDTIVNDTRNIEFTIVPQRNSSRYELVTKTDLELKSIAINGTNYGQAGEPIVRSANRQILAYYLSNSEKELTVICSLAADANFNLSLREISFDLMENEQFQIKPRSNNMTPYFSVYNDAIILTKEIKI